MASMLEMVTEIVAAHASSTRMSTEELLAEIEQVHTKLSKLEESLVQTAVSEETRPSLTLKQAFRKDEVVCMLCGKGKMKTLARHLSKEHGLRPGEYRKQFGIPRTQPLTAKSFSDDRRKRAEERGLGEILVKAREVRANKAKAQAQPQKQKPVPNAKTPTKMAGRRAQTA